ncbi:1,2-phenylacetyl-CoA epoxidase subunit PaaD [Ferrovibrio sp.]|uniref:1,2-phenylacetyl-CoA epoxidase subunit PaaD n=1 Tax=Ferrovibrio sp. TaxID=1917215 RepID=UPI00311F6EA3
MTLPLLPAREAYLVEVHRIAANVPDPEIPAVTIEDLGILSAVHDKDGQAEVVLIPTYSGCPATDVIRNMVRQALHEAGHPEVGVRTALSPAWSSELITDAGREKLRAYGIAPPQKRLGGRSLFSEQTVNCPNCGSGQTQRVSEFGSTPCKALWRCNACREPFDYFKCI